MVYRGETYTSRLNTYNNEGTSLITPEDISIKVIDPSDQILIEDTPTELETGKYEYEYPVSIEADLGVYKVIWTVTFNEGIITEIDPFTVQPIITGSISDLRTLIAHFSGITKPEDLKLSDQEYENLLDKYILAVKDFIDRYTRTDYTSLETYPEGLNLILVEIIANILRSQLLRQDTPTIDIENYNKSSLIEASLSEDIKERLKPYTAKPRIKVRKF